MKFSYKYESYNNISEKMLHEVEILSWNCTPFLVNLELKGDSHYVVSKAKITVFYVSRLQKFIVREKVFRNNP